METDSEGKEPNFDHEMESFVAVKMEESSGEFEHETVVKEESEPYPIEVQTPIFTFESIIIKSEPDDASDADKADYEDTTDIFENIPPSKMKKANKKTKSVKVEKKKEPPSVCDPRFYDVEVNKCIELVTITEDVRKNEHAAMLIDKANFKYRCDHCAMGFVLLNAYEKHMVIHTKESGEYRCDLCQSYLKTENTLYKHKLRHYRRYRCLKCTDSVLYRNKETAASHLRMVHFNKAFQCEICHKNFRRKVYLKIHVEQKHTMPGDFECPICQRHFHERSFFRIHVRNHNTEVRASTCTDPTRYTCDICLSTFKRKSYLRDHMATKHTKQDNAECPICRRVYKNRSVMMSHKRREHHKVKVDERVECPVCQKVITNKVLLKGHIRRKHGDREKKYTCDHCLSTFFSKGELREHISWQHMRNEKSGVFCECGLQLKNQTLLKSHIDRVHKGIKKPKDKECEVCGKAFINSVVLRRHMLIHTGEAARHSCTVCDKTFCSRQYLQTHYQLKHLNMTRQQIAEIHKLKKTHPYKEIVANLVKNFVDVGSVKGKNSESVKKSIQLLTNGEDISKKDFSKSVANCENSNSNSEDSKLENGTHSFTITVEREDIKQEVDD